MRKPQFFLILIIMFILSTCLWTCSGGSGTMMDQPVVARVGDRVITAREFMQRAEYTIRPAWCATDQYVHRKIVLNSLIAEKLLAADFKSADSLLEANPAVRNYLRGRKEQEMRQLHFEKKGLERVEIDDARLARAISLAERTYRLQIIPVNDDRLARRIAVDLQAGRTTFDALVQEIEQAGQKIPQREVAFDAPLEDALFKSLFLNNVQKGQIVGPLHLDKNSNLLVRVNGWTRRPVLSDEAGKQKRHDVTEKLRQVRGRDIYESWIAGLMRGKRIQFNDPVFRIVTEAAGNNYFQSKQEKKEAFRQKFWHSGDSDKKVLDDLAARLDEIQDQPLFTVDDQVWTVARFEEYMQIHPLVFRSRKMNKAEFAGQFRLAIADMVRDYYITEDAYAEGFDEHPLVRQRTAMWQDNLIALYRRNQLLQGVHTDSLSQEAIVDRFIEPQIGKLRRQYAPQVYINIQEFEKLRLTSVDMFVLQDNVPFPVAVPQFPALTRHDDLDYGQRMN